MRARRVLLLAAYWLTTCTLAAVASLAAALPLTGMWASTTGILAAAVVLLAGHALEPRRKDTGR